MSSHAHRDTFAHANKEFFDSIAAHYEDLAIAHDRARAISTAIRKGYEFDPETTIAMEFAAGTGLVTRELVPYVKRIVGVDISPASIDKFNDNAKKQNISHEKIQGYALELRGEEGELNGQKFDVILCSQAYHHFESINNMTHLLASFLKPGGTLIVVDFMAHNEAVKYAAEEVLVGSAEDAMKMHKPQVNFHHVIPHMHGIAEASIREAVDKAGLVDFRFKYIFTSFGPNGDKQPIFIVRAVKPTEAV